MSTNVRMMIAMAVSIVIVILWSMFILPKPAIVEQPNQQEEVASDATQSESQEEESAYNETTPEEEESIGASEEMVEKSVSAETIKTVTVETDLYRVELSNQAGGSVKSWQIKGFEESFSDKPFDLIGNSDVRGKKYKPFSTVIRDAKGNYNQLPGIPVVSGDIVGGEMVFDGEKATIIFEYADEKFGHVKKEFTFYRNSFVVDVAFENQLNKEYRDSEVLLLMGGGIGDLVRIKDDGIVEAGREANGFLLRKANEGVEKKPALITQVSPEDYKNREAALAGKYFTEGESTRAYYVWAGLENNYFMTLAYGDSGFSSIYQLAAVNEIKSGEKIDHYSVPYLGIKTEKDKAFFKMYCGPKDLQILEKVGQGQLKEVVNFGMFSFISKPALWLMQQIFNFTNNYGVAIILLTILINLMTLPLIIKQRKSMGQMQLIQPQIKAIQAKYKVDKGDDAKKRQDKKAKLNEETMALYKAEGVNPMGGCMPLLIQMPILFALLDMFRAAIELRKAPFFLWWDNLSAMDPTYILPIVMAGAMFLSMKLTPTAVDAQQNSAMKFMPFMMAFILASMPSGLVLYWTTSNLFSLGTQVIMNKVSPVKKKSEEKSKKKLKKPEEKKK